MTNHSPRFRGGPVDPEALRSFFRWLDFLPVPTAVDRVVGVDERGFPRQQLLFHNRRFVELIGYTVEEFNDSGNWMETVYPDPAYRREVIDGWLSERDKARARGSSFVSLTTRLLCKDGEYRWFEIMHDFERGLAEGFMVFAFNDVTRLKAAQEELEQVASTDYLTGLATRRFMQSQLEIQAARTERSGRPFACLLADVDRFKSINDTHGHAGGDRVLQDVGKLFAQSVRTGDIAARWGGEEFLVLMPDIDESGAMRLAERLRAAVAEVALPGGGSSLSMSIGVRLHHPGDSLSETLQKADNAMYEGKAKGGDRVVLVEH